MELSADAASVDTGNGRRDEHLRSADFFDVAHHPDIRFRSTSVRERATGACTWRASSRPPADGCRSRSTPCRAGRRPGKLEAVTTVDQRRLGMTWSPLGTARTPTTFSVHASLRRDR
jgi:polyisoprenoid-binding protein YceI